MTNANVKIDSFFIQDYCENSKFMTFAKWLPIRKFSHDKLVSENEYPEHFEIDRLKTIEPIISYIDLKAIKTYLFPRAIKTK